MNVCVLRHLALVVTGKVSDPEKLSFYVDFNTLVDDDMKRQVVNTFGSNNKIF